MNPPPLFYFARGVSWLTWKQIERALLVGMAVGSPGEEVQVWPDPVELTTPLTWDSPTR